MIIHKIGDVLKQEDAKYICHQVNCKGVMGAGLAKQIKPLLNPNSLIPIGRHAWKKERAVWDRYRSWICRMDVPLLIFLVRTFRQELCVTQITLLYSKAWKPRKILQ